MSESDFQMMKRDLIEGMKKDILLTIGMAVLYLSMVSGFALMAVGGDGDLVNILSAVGIIGFGWAFIIAAVFKKYHLFFWHALLIVSLIAFAFLGALFGL